jgi:hypothetical protein
MGLTSAGGQVRVLSQVPSTEARPLPDSAPASIFSIYSKILPNIASPSMYADTQKRVMRWIC